MINNDLIHIHMALTPKEAGHTPGVGIVN